MSRGITGALQAQVSSSGYVCREGLRRVKDMQHALAASLTGMRGATRTPNSVYFQLQRQVCLLWLVIATLCTIVSSGAWR